MKFYRCIILSLISLFLTTTANATGVENSSAEIFASNNTNEIDLQTAFNKLQSKNQEELQNETIKVLQDEHIEQSKFENLLGTYKMENDQNLTADNSEKVITSSMQKLSSEKILMTAIKLANVLKQESVAVFIPTKEPVIGDTILKLKSHRYSMNETITLIREKLPSQYSQAFSLHLSNDSCTTFNNAVVDQVEWLGSKIKSDEIMKSFPQEEITYHYGKAFLVYKNGKREQL